MHRAMERTGRGLLVGLLTLLVTGCVSTRYQTETPRSATEQLLLSDAIEAAVAELEWPDVSGRAVAVEVVALSAGDASYLAAAAEARLAAAGAQLVDPGEAQLLLVLRAGALGTVSRSASFGIPELPVPGGLVTPSIPFVKALKQRAYVKLRLVGFDGTGVQRASAGPVMARKKFDVYSLFFLVLRRNDIYPGEASSLGID